MCAAASEIIYMRFNPEMSLMFTMSARALLFIITTITEAEWESVFFFAGRNKLPGVPFAGPDVANNANWITLAFAENESKNVILLDGHYYTTGPATDKSITYHDILSFNSILNSYLQSIEAEASSNNLPNQYFDVEKQTNVYGGGKMGVSDAFASSLWALDVMWTVAENQGSGINFHDGDNLYYSPIANRNGVFSASPEYYAMLAFKFASANGLLFTQPVLKSPSALQRLCLC